MRRRRGRKGRGEGGEVSTILCASASSVPSSAAGYFACSPGRCSTINHIIKFCLPEPRFAIFFAICFSLPGAFVETLFASVAVFSWFFFLTSLGDFVDLVGVCFFASDFALFESFVSAGLTGCSLL
eukprot:753290-Hanusia_phi.AAC.3